MMRLLTYVQKRLISEQELVKCGLPTNSTIEFSTNLYKNVQILNSLEYFSQNNPGVEWDINETMRSLYFLHKDAL